MLGFVTSYQFFMNAEPFVHLSVSKMQANSLGEFRNILSRIKDLEKRTENVDCTLIKNDLQKINETVSLAEGNQSAGLRKN